MYTYSQIIQQVPSHLRKYVVDQNYARYTAEDQAAWRYVLRQLTQFLSVHAHPCYMEGLRRTGVSLDSIPHISKMSERLQEFGWRALPVSGFIPPAAFMELQSLSFLPIASDMRSVDHIFYTPAPDIVHEAAGHAPILVEPEFAQYLKSYAAVARRSILFKHDLEQYEAIRILSDLKESHLSTAKEIEAANFELNRVNTSIQEISEAGLLGRMNWWTAEYGLIGTLSEPKIFGAGLLSSIGESRHCLSAQVKKLPLSIDCLEYSYDITEPQPQLFVAKDFDDLHDVLNQMAKQLAFNKSADQAIPIVLRSQTVNTAVFSNGLSVSGVFNSIQRANAKIIFIKTDGGTQLSTDELQMDGHGPDYHSHGYSSPIGPLRGNLTWKSIHPLKASELGWKIGSSVHLRYESGFEVIGTIVDVQFRENTLELIKFSHCTVRQGDQVFFQPEWGFFDLLAADELIQFYGGAADRGAFGEQNDFAVKVVPTKDRNDSQKEYDRRLGLVRMAYLNSDRTQYEELKNLKSHEMSWITALELLELAEKFADQDYSAQIKEHLYTLMQSQHHLSDLIKSGLEALKASNAKGHSK